MLLQLHSNTQTTYVMESYCICNFKHDTSQVILCNNVDSRDWALTFARNICQLNYKVRLGVYAHDGTITQHTQHISTGEPYDSSVLGKYRKISTIRRTLIGNKIVDHSDVVGASPVGAAPTTSSFSTWHLASRDSAKTAARQYENLLSVGIWCDLY